MWLSKTKENETAAAAEGGVTVSGGKTAAQAGTESRNARLIAPGGYLWKPAVGDSVLVFKEKDGTYITAVTGSDKELQPGEVIIVSAGGSSIKLSNDGSVYIKGNLTVEGRVTENGA